MTVPLPPPIDRRDARHIERQILGNPASGLPGLRQTYTPAWTAAPGGSDVGVALTALFGRLMELLIARLNAAPLKHRLAFFDLLGIDRLPGNPARTPVRFFLPTGNRDGGFVRAGTQVVSGPTPSGTIHVFETANGLDVTPAVLKTLIVLRPDLDLFVDGTAVIDGAGGSPIGLDAASGMPIEHSFYLGDAARLGFSEGADLGVEIHLTGVPPTAPPESRWSVAWESFAVDSAGVGAWSPMTPSPGSALAARLLASGEIVFPGFTGTAPSDQGPAPAGGSSYWIRARLTTPLVPAVLAMPGLPPQIESVRVRRTIARAALLPDAAFFNTLRLDVTRDFQPFGAQPRLADTFYLANAEAFSKPGAIVTIHLDLSQDITVGPSPNLDLRWETWTDKGWTPLVVSDGSAAFTVGTAGAPPAGDITFTVPSGVVATPLNGVTSFWVRVRIAAGNYGGPGQYVPRPWSSPVEFDFVPESFHPPSLGTLTIDYVKTYPLAVPEKVLTFNTFDWTNARPALTPPGSAVQPFQAPADAEPAMYLGFDAPFGDRRISLFVDVREDESAAGAMPAPAALEYSTPSGFSSLDVDADETNGLMNGGVLSFFGTDDQAALDRFGVSRFWIRVPLAAVSAGRTIAAVHLNTVQALNRTTIANETLGSGSGVSGQTIALSQHPVFEGERVFVREPEPPSDRELADLAATERVLLGRQPTSAEIDALVRVLPNAATGTAETWVRWQPVRTFSASGPRSRHYVIDRVAGTLAFGDGVHGLMPPIARDNIRAFVYQAGGGALASREVKAGGIKQLRSLLPFVDRVRNLLDAEGGSDPEGLADVVERAPQTIKNRNRAVTSEDYVWLARQASTLVHKARCLPTRNGQLAFQPGAVAVLIVPDSDDPRPRPSLELMREVRTLLVARALPLIADSIFVVPPLYREVRVQAEVVPLRAEEAGLVEGRSVAQLNAFLHPVRGGPAGTGWEFGRDVRISEIHQVLEEVPGVDVVLSVVLNGDATAMQVDVGDNELPVAGTHQIVMRPPSFAG